MPIPAEIASAPTAPLKMNPADPATAQSVQEFLAAMGPSPRPAPAEPEEGAPEKMQVHVPPNDDFNRPLPADSVLQNALASVDPVSVTEEDKDTYLRALLTDTPLKLRISLYGGRLLVDLRARYSYEQRRIFDLVQYEQEQGLMAKDNPSLAFNRVQLFCAVLMVERINGELFSELVLKAGRTLAEDQDIMHRQVHEKLDGITMVRWTAIMQAMRQFEAKCARLNEEAINEGFWTPRGAAA